MRRSSPAVASRERLKRCAIYTRKSTTMGLEQEFNTLDAQREACEAYVRSQAGAGWMALEERYDDGGFTGANIDRPAFQRLLADVDSGLVDTIVVYKLDRISRSLLDFATVMNRLTKAGVGFVSVTQNFSTADAVGRMTLNLLATFAEFEREQIGERTRDKLAASRRRGRWTGGQVPIGYRVVDKKLVVEPAEAEVVREIFELYLEEHSALSVALKLGERGRLTKRHLAATGRLRESRIWGKGDVLRVLKTPLYAGYMRYQDELHEGEHEAIIDRLSFERARALVARVDRHQQPRRRNIEFLLSGIVKCALCGASLCAASTPKQASRYRYYRCTTRDRRGRKACRTMPVSAPAIEEFVAEQLRKAVAETELLQEVEAAAASLDATRKRLRSEAARLAREVAAASEATLQHRTQAAPATAGPDGKDRELGSRLCALERQLAEVEREILVVEGDRVETGWVAQCLRQFGEVWDMLTEINKGRLFRAVVERVEVDDDAGEVRVVLAVFGSTGCGEAGA